VTSLEAALSWTYHLAFAITVTRTWREQSRESLEPADYHAFLVALGLATIGSDEPGGTQNSSQQEDCSMYGNRLLPRVVPLSAQRADGSNDQSNGFNLPPTSREI
jgi:hypothetical protein